MGARQSVAKATVLVGWYLFQLMRMGREFMVIPVPLHRRHLHLVVGCSPSSSLQREAERLELDSRRCVLCVMDASHAQVLSHFDKHGLIIDVQHLQRRSLPDIECQAIDGRVGFPAMDKA